MVTMNSSPDIIKEIDSFPIKEVNGKTVFLRDVAHVHDGFQVQTNSVSVNGKPGALMTIRKTGGVSTLAVIDGIRKDCRRLRTYCLKARLLKRFSINRFSSKPRSTVSLLAGLWRHALRP